MSAEPKASPRDDLGDATPTAIRDWIELFPIAAWVVDDLRFLLHANEAARALLGMGATREGFWRCLEDCPVCAGEEAPEPTLVQWKEMRGLWLRLFTLPSSLGQRVHCAVDATREKRMEDYLLHSIGGEPRVPLEALSAREEEILSALAEGLRPEQIARKLNLSKVTVRNHVQHILRKLGHHSTQAAIAQWLLRPERRPSDRL